MQGVRYPADQFSLLSGGIEEPEAILKAPAISDFGLEFQWLCHFRQLEFQLNNFANLHFTWNRSAQSAFSNIFGPAMLRIFASYY